MEKIKLRKKITAQLIVIVSIFMILIHAVSLIVLVSTAKTMYTKAKDELISLNIRRTKEVFEPKDSSYGIGPVPFLEYCADHLDEVKVPIDPDDEEASAILNEIYNRYSDSPNKHFNEFSDIEKSVYSRLRYEMVLNNVQEMHLNYSAPSLAIVFKSKEGKIMVLASESNEGLPANFINDVVTSEYNKNKTIDNLKQQTKNGEPISTIIDADNGSWYVSYLPFFEESDYNFSICYVSDFGQYRETLIRTVVWVVVSHSLSFVFIVAFLILFLYRRTAKPVKYIQSSVQKYKTSKDTEQVVSDLNKIHINNEFGMLAKDVSDMAITMQKYNEENIKFASDAKRISTELELAMKIQMSALPSVENAFENHNDFELAASMNPAKEVGGDFYDFFPLIDNKICLIIADVSGKGVPAALFMMMAKMQIQGYAKMGLSPAKILENANNAICKDNKETMFVTAWVGIVDTKTGKVVASNAGHLKPIIKKSEGEFELYKDKHGPIVGAFSGVTYPEYEFEIGRGGTLFLYTDGVTEANNANDLQFGEDNVIKSLNNCKSTHPNEILEYVKKDLGDFVGDEEQFDDITMVAITIE